MFFVNKMLNVLYNKCALLKPSYPDVDRSNDATLKSVPPEISERIFCTLCPMQPPTYEKLRRRMGISNVEMDDMPPEILREIFDHLDPGAMQNVVSCGSKFRGIALESAYVNELESIKHFIKFLKKNLIERLTIEQFAILEAI